MRDAIPVSGDRQLLDAVLDAATSLIVVMDTSARLIRWNRACQELFGYPAEELGAPGALLDLVVAADRPIAEAAARALIAGEPTVRAELRCRTRDGDLRRIDWSTTVLTHEGEVTYLVATGVDVTEARRWAADRAAVEDRLRHMADHDALTGLFNRRRFEEELERHLAHGRRYGMDGALLMLDLDGFKAVNDNHGHREGDRVLAEVAEVLRQRLRETDVVARFGGDEFAVLMPHGGEAEAAELARLLPDAVRSDVVGPDGPLDASAGFAVFDDSATADGVLSRADDAMYADKSRSHAAARRLPSVE